MLQLLSSDANPHMRTRQGQSPEPTYLRQYDGFADEPPASDFELDPPSELELESMHEDDCRRCDEAAMAASIQSYFSGDDDDDRPRPGSAALMKFLDDDEVIFVAAACNDAVLVAAAAAEITRRLAA